MQIITKVILLCMFSILLIGCAGSQVISTDAERVTQTAAKIADFDLPTDYSPDFSAQLKGYNVAAFHPGDGHSHLYLIQSEKTMDGEKLAAMVAELTPGAGDQNMTVTETRPAIVCGQQTTVVIFDGINSEGIAYRQVTTAFQGKGGPAILIFSEPRTRWNQETVDALIASIH